MVLAEAHAHQHAIGSEGDVRQLELTVGWQCDGSLVDFGYCAIFHCIDIRFVSLVESKDVSHAVFLNLTTDSLAGKNVGCHELALGGCAHVVLREEVEAFGAFNRVGIVFVDDCRRLVAFAFERNACV